MSDEEELAFLKVRLGELSPVVFGQMKRDIIPDKKRREAEAAAKAKEPGERPTGQPSARQPGSAGGGGETSVYQKAPRATAGKRKANELDSSDSRGSMESATRRPCHCPEPGQRLCLHRQREAPPKARWLNPPLSRANKPRPAAGKSATLRLAPRKPGWWPGDRSKEQMLGWIPRHCSPQKRGLPGG
jgi:hypothetical protein